MAAFTISRPRMNSGFSRTDGRYEYRVWPRQSLSAISDLHRFWTLEFAENRADIYLLGACATPDLVKLRNGTRLEIKRRIGDLMGLQYWQVDLSQDFPLSVFTLNRLSVAFVLSEALPAHAGLSPAHLLAALRPFTGGVDARIAQKSRLSFRRGSTRAEITRVKLDGRSWMTVATEDPDPIIAAQTVNALGLSRLPNQSYGDFLRAAPLLIAEPTLNR